MLWRGDRCCGPGFVLDPTRARERRRWDNATSVFYFYFVWAHDDELCGKILWLFQNDECYRGNVAPSHRECDVRYFQRSGEFGNKYRLVSFG